MKKIGFLIYTLSPYILERRGTLSSGLLMWIAIQHLYGIYTDFKKTINPIQYYDNGGDDFDCDDSVISARMADRPPVSFKMVLTLSRAYEHY